MARFFIGPIEVLLRGRGVTLKFEGAFDPRFPQKNSRTKNPKISKLRIKNCCVVTVL
jgi:hypothetical protein